MSRTLHFSIGPVQEFVSQSRRTRDLLMSSFLLSFLTGHAMIEVIRCKGRIVFPQVDENPLLLAIQQSNDDLQEEGLWIGSLPNRFQAEIPNEFEPAQCVQAVNKAWLRIANTIWEKVVEPIANHGKDTEKIWQRQVENFWEINWVRGSDRNLLDRRKYWRNFVPSEEEGDKCMLVSHLQELSGYLRAHEPVKQDNFWNKIHKSRYADLFAEESKERLSAIGMIKRYLPLLTKEALGWEFPEEAKYFPSTRYLGSYPFRKKVVENASLQEQRDRYAALALKKYPLTHTGRRYFGRQGDRFSRLVENALQPDNIKDYPKLYQAFQQLCQSVGSEPTNYYALLMMDGDRLGAWLQQVEAQEVGRISHALAQFTGSVQEIVKAKDGTLVYAGGDDVMALFPLNTVLEATFRLRKAYQQAFANVFPEQESSPTISAGLVFAHSKASLKQMVSISHTLLDEIAKEKHGRDSIAIGIYNNSGALIQWGAPWELILDHDTNRLVVLANELALTPSFLYHLKDTYESFASVTEEESLKKMLLAEWERINGKPTIVIEQQLKQLIEFGYHAYYDENNKLVLDKQSFSADIALLVRWLRDKGVTENADLDV
ncbi:CRISPR-associated protein, Cmr2 family [Seinonella peptonophila]|uniref:CRISPR-associated protein, Cmr2 family n=1 Tax=Seinonella peptonophila TaxID=112248 RepID=A0A1M5BNB7_9BACL|nr:type III-B CRISPR-associated protein Cas10/Cmr2 [Seinonella peptonophila]SHF43717.1 CRISPR-associated protein, Cmr2 family [Seinonella peptonophila]